MYCKICGERPAQKNKIFCKGCETKLNYLKRNKNFFNRNNADLKKLDKIERYED